MSEFTYTVFVVVASMAGALMALFIGVIGLALGLDTSTFPGTTARPHTDSPGEYQQAA